MNVADCEPDKVRQLKVQGVHKSWVVGSSTRLQSAEKVQTRSAALKQRDEYDSIRRFDRWILVKHVHVQARLRSQIAYVAPHVTVPKSIRMQRSHTSERLARHSHCQFVATERHRGYTTARRGDDVIQWSEVQEGRNTPNKSEKIVLNPVAETVNEILKIFQATLQSLLPQGLLLILCIPA